MPTKAQEDSKKATNTDATKSTATTTSGDKKPKKKSSAMVAASKGRSAVNAVIADSAGTVRGSNGLANTGPATTYENED